MRPGLHGPSVVNRHRSGAGEDVVGADAAPDDVLGAADYLRAVRPRRAPVPGPGELVDAGRALDALDAQAGAEAAGAEVGHERVHDDVVEAAAPFGSEAG